jgi:uncharacterized protein (DUF433 family)
MLKVPSGTMRGWLSENTGFIPRRLSGDQRTLTFIELMELHFVKMFRDEGVSTRTIKKTSQAAAKKFHSQYPFTVKRFDTDGRTIFATLKSEDSTKELLEDLARGQLRFTNIVRPFFRKLDYGSNQEVVRFWPQQKRGRVVLDPARKFGQPIDAETGVPTRAIYDAVMAGKGQDASTVAGWLGIPVSAVHAAVKFEQSLSV